MPKLRSIFNFNHPWLDFNLFFSAKYLLNISELGIVIGCLYHLIPLNIPKVVNSPSISDGRLASICKIMCAMVLGWGYLDTKLLLTPDLTNRTVQTQEGSKKRSALRNLEHPWLNRYVEVTLISTAYFCSFFTQLMVKTSLELCNPLLPELFSISILGVVIVDWFKPFIRRHDIAMTMNSLIHRRYIDPQRQKLANERVLLSRSFLETGQSSSKFEYRPLTSTAMIRLLKIEVDESKRATCDLIEADIENTPPYDALSYCWGTASPEDKYFLMIASAADCCIHITKNAHDALQSLTPNCGIRYIWIDSVCINQKDKLEKSHQLPLMNQIYRNADSVVVFLGGDLEDSCVLQFLNKLFCFYFLQIRTLTKQIISDDSVDHTIFDRRFIAEPKDVESVRDLLSNEYWKRGWIVQECVLAKEITVLFGGIPIPWMIFTGTIVLLGKQDHFITSMIASFDSLHKAATALVVVTRLAELRAGYAAGDPPQSLVDLVVLHHLTKTSDPKDKVYAFLRLCSKADFEALQPNYEKDLKNVYMDFMRLALLQNSYFPFSLSGLSSDEHGLGPYQLPSWLPRWFSEFEFNTGKYHSASYKAGLELSPEFEIVTSDTILRLKGVFVDTIHHVTSSFNHLEFSEKIHNHPVIELFAEQISILMQMRDLFNEKLSGNQQPEEAFWRTILHLHPQRNIWSPEERANIIDELNNCLNLFRDTNPLEQIGPEHWLRLSMREMEDRGFKFQSRLWNNSVAAVFSMKSFAITMDKQLLASVPVGTKFDDIVVIFNGAPAPVILRANVEEQGCYYLLGEAYVDSIMYGEAMNVENSRWFSLC